RGAAGAPVRACAAGRVVLAGDHFFAGRCVYVDHGQGLVSMYFHLSEILVAEGQMLARGEVLGRVGESGRVTGPHLHWGLAVQGQLVDPLLLAERPPRKGKRAP
ncbi:MAG: M23 family metallopeptidase, partial [Candidatus Krumholzibacteriota bacterium]|nr:M23 family metallopeptidase [Candidatus Krumholzibacteriota bacterium]